MHARVQTDVWRTNVQAMYVPEDTENPMQHCNTYVKVNKNLDGDFDFGNYSNHEPYILQTGCVK